MFHVHYSLFIILNASLKRFTLIFLLLFAYSANSQVVYESTRHNEIYDLLDELASEKLISINSVVKPFSRIFIAKKLQEALEQKDALNPRQQEEIEGEHAVVLDADRFT